MYLGNQPALAYTSFAKQDFTTSATTNYVLDQAVTNANEIALFINFVRQEPTTAYTASGTALTLTSATTAGDDMYCIFLGKALQTINPPAGSVGASQITDGSITSAKFASGAIANQSAFKNIIINGDMSIAQRSTSVASITTGGYYTLDRFLTVLSSLGTWTQSQDSDVPSGQGFATSLKMACTTANASPTSSAQALIRQIIEGQNLQYIKKGTANAESLTLSFWVKSNKTGTYIVEFRDTDNTREISKSYTINSADTWEKKTLTFAGDTTGTFNNDNNASLQVGFYLGAGTNLTSGTLQTSWGSEVNANRAVGQVNLADSTSNYINVTGVQLEAGTTASDFEFLPFDVNMNRCQRYYQKSYDYGTSLGTATGNGVVGKSGNTSMGTTTSEIVESATLLKEMRSAPSITLYDTAGNVGKVTTVNFGVSEYANQNGSGYRIGSKYFAIQATSLSNPATSFSCHFTANAEL